MAILSEAQILTIMREEYEKRLEELEGQIDSFMKAPSAGKNGIISAETKVKHKGSQILYTVHGFSLNRKWVILRTPEGKLMKIPGDQFEKEYTLD